MEAQSGRWGSSDIRTPGQDLVRPSLECSGTAGHLCYRLLPLSSSLPLGVPRLSELPAPKVTGTHLQSLGTLVIITTAGEEHSWILPNSGSQVLK